MIGLADAKSRRPLHAFVQDEGDAIYTESLKLQTVDVHFNKRIRKQLKVIITIDEDEDSEDDDDEVDDRVSNLMINLTKLNIIPRNCIVLFNIVFTFLIIDFRVYMKSLRLRESYKTRDNNNNTVSFSLE
jgi:hypothetical protein